MIAHASLIHGDSHTCHLILQVLQLNAVKSDTFHHVAGQVSMYFSDLVHKVGNYPLQDSQGVVWNVYHILGGILICLVLRVGE